MEIWKEIKGYEGYYEVSSFGNIRSMNRVVNHAKGGVMRIKQKNIKLNNHSSGYKIVSLSKDGIVKTNLVHRLVALTFITNTDSKPEINHKDLDKKNNSISNLEWVTSKENKDHFAINSQILQIEKFCKGEKHPKSKITEKQAFDIKYNSGHLKLRELREIYGLSLMALSHIRNGTNWAHI